MSSSCSSLRSHIPIPTLRPFPTLTSQPSETPTPTFTPSPSMTPSPTPAAIAGFSTPIPTLQQIISPQNASHLQLFARFGYGIAQQITGSPALNFLAVASSHGVALYDINTLHAIYTFDTGEFQRCLAFSPDARFLASGSTNGNLYVWDMADKSLQYTFQGGGEPFINLAFSPDSNFLTASSMERHIDLWDLTEGKLVNTFTAIQDPIQSLSFSPDGTLLYAWAFKESIQVWKISDGSSLTDIYIGKDNQGKYPSLGLFSANGSLFAAASDFRVRIFTTSNGRTLRLISDIQQPVSGLAFSNDTRYLAIEGGSQAKIWNVENGKLVATVELPPVFISHLMAFSPGIETLLTLGGAIQAWNFTSEGSTAAAIDQPAQSGPTEFVSNFTLAASISPDSQGLYALSLDAFLNTYQLHTNEILPPYHLKQESASAAAFAYSAPFAAVGNLNGEVDVWDTSSGNLAQALMGQEGAIRSLALSSDGELLASGSDEMGVYVWRVSDGSLQYTLSLDGVPQEMAFTPNGEMLILHIPGEISIWDLMSQSQTTTFSGDGMTLSPDGQVLAIKTFLGGSTNVELRSMPDGALISVIPARGISMAFSSDHALLASADKPLTVWRVSDGHLLATLSDMDLFGIVRFSPDDRLLVLATLDGAIRTWGIP